jgi:nucleoside-diphosphate-sugar epimerase
VPDNTPRNDGGRPRSLVTGANGFMGTHMLELLAKFGSDVVATDIGDDPSPTAKGLGTEYVKADLRSKSDVVQLLRGRAFDYVFDIKGLFDYSAPYKDLYDVNVRGSLNLLNGLAEAGIKPQRMVTWGAAGVYDFTKESPTKETSPVNPQGGYLTTKYVQEMLMLEQGPRLGIPVTIVRPGGVYGPRSRYGVATSIFIAARGGMGPFYFGPGKTRAGMVHVEDVCGAALFLARRHEAEGQIYNVNDDSAYPTSELMRTAARWLDFPLLPVNFPLAVMKFFVGNLGKKAAKKGRISLLNEEMTALVAYDALLDPSKLKALGWRAKWPDSLKGLEATIKWYREEGWL